MIDNKKYSPYGKAYQIVMAYGEKYMNSHIVIGFWH